MTDGTKDFNDHNYRQPLFYHLAQNAVIQMAEGLAQELHAHQCTAVALTPGWMRSEIMLDIYGVKEENWRDAIEKEPHFIISESPRYVGCAVAALAGDENVSR